MLPAAIPRVLPSHIYLAGDIIANAEDRSLLEALHINCRSRSNANENDATHHCFVSHNLLQLQLVCDLPLLLLLRTYISLMRLSFRKTQSATLPTIYYFNTSLNALQRSPQA